MVNLIQIWYGLYFVYLVVDCEYDGGIYTDNSKEDWIVPVVCGWPILSILMMLVMMLMFTHVFNQS